ncbi:MAG TPA: C4-type zinc ribbon domain-containing protein [Actinomycetes bacterium]|nr:C4-type zinc ribbon domain-containing protein [Actinomycetes bacterium]
MRAPPEEQRTLLELQGIDSTVDRLTHRRADLPEEARLVELGTQLDAIGQLAAERDGTLVTTRREQERIEHEVETLGGKADAEDARAAAGRVTSPKELTAIQAEVQALRRRVATLEDELLERMEARETLERELAELTARREAAERERAQAATARDAAVAEIGRQLAKERAAREALTRRIGAPLLELYEKVRGRSGGIGAAALAGETCQGCHMRISAVELKNLRAMPPEEIKRCEHCRRILVVS